MVGKCALNFPAVAVSGFLTMTLPALRQLPDGDFEIPKFLSKKAGGEAVCAAEWIQGNPEELVVVNEDDTISPWEQDRDINFEVSKEKELYLISYNSAGYKEFFKLKASGQVAKQLHQKFQKGDQVVIFGDLATIGRNNFLTCREVLKVQKI